MEKNPIFVVIFKDNTKYMGGLNWVDTKWLGMPLKPIDKIFYRLPTNDYICLAQYERFYHKVEVTEDIIINQTIKKQKPIIRYAYIMGEKNNKVFSYRITLSNSYKIKANIELDDGKVREYKQNEKLYVERRYFSDERKKWLIKKATLSAYKLQKGDKLFFNVENKIKYSIVKDKTLERIKGRYCLGDVSIKVFDIQDEEIKKLNPMWWR